MEFFKRTPTIDFMGKRRITYVISACLMIGSFVLLAVRGLNLGIDFTGGVVVEVSLSGGGGHRPGARCARGGRIHGRPGAVLRQFARPGRARHSGGRRRRQPGERADPRGAERVGSRRRGTPHGSRRSAGRARSDRAGRPRDAVHVHRHPDLCGLSFRKEDGGGHGARGHARSHRDSGLFRGHADDVRSGGAGGRAGRHRLLHQRHGRRIRPRARSVSADAQGDADRSASTRRSTRRCRVR